MGKRSSFERRPQDAYATPAEAVKPLLPHLRPRTRYSEPCCGDGALIGHLEDAGHLCNFWCDIAPPPEGEWSRQMDALALESCIGECWITNPPWRRDMLHPLITHLSSLAPAWLLMDAEWMNTKQAVPFLPWCHRPRALDPRHIHVEQGLVLLIPLRPDYAEAYVRAHILRQGVMTTHPFAV